MTHYIKNIAKNGFTHMKTHGNIAILCCFLCLHAMFLAAIFFLYMAVMPLFFLCFQWSFHHMTPIICASCVKIISACPIILKISSIMIINGSQCHIYFEPPCIIHLLTYRYMQREHVWIVKYTLKSNNVIFSMFWISHHVKYFQHFSESPIQLNVVYD